MQEGMRKKSKDIQFLKFIFFLAIKQMFDCNRLVLKLDLIGMIIKLFVLFAYL